MWGIELQLDLYGCDPDLIRSETHIREFVRRLCDLIGMTMYGDTQIVRFGKDPRVTGYSMNQFIEESNITGHFVESINCAAINIFSCKVFDAFAAQRFAEGWFRASRSNATVLERLTHVEEENHDRQLYFPF